jgi:CubicO group peptidase (beta-lactamase class C family)
MTTVSDHALPADPELAGLDPVALENLTAFVRRDIDAGLHSGATILVARGGVVGYHEAIGLADVTTQRPSRLDDMYLLMSLTKSITAVAVLQLIERGLLSFDTRISDVIPEYAQRGKQRVTVYQLLTHTGGAFSSYELPAGLDYFGYGDLTKTTAALAALPVLHRPGARVVYSPFEAHAILGEVIRRLDPGHRSFREIIHDEVFAPLGMTSSSIGAPVDHPRRVPITVLTPNVSASPQDADQWGTLNKVGEEGEMPAVNGFATTSDLFRFAEALRLGGANDHGRVLSGAMTDYAYRNHTGDMPNEFWDFGKEAADLPDFPGNFGPGSVYVRGVGHYLTPLGQLASPSAFLGAGGAAHSWMVDPDRELTVIFLSAGMLEGLRHMQRLQRVNDLALAAVR